VGGIGQLQPGGTQALNRLVRSVADPDSVQQCRTGDGVRYCTYPHFGPEAQVWQQAISGVLALVPQRPTDTLTVRQSSVALQQTGTVLRHGHSSQQLARWSAQLRTAPGSQASASTIYLAVGSWPSGTEVSAALFQVASPPPTGPSACPPARVRKSCPIR
jgi:hypothetical protein